MAAASTSAACLSLSAAATPHKQQSPITMPKLHVTSRSAGRSSTKLHVSSSSKAVGAGSRRMEESIFFDGGAHYGDLVANLVLGLTLVWLPLTLAAVLRAFFLRYRFTDVRVTVISGLTGQERSDFSYEVVKDVQVVPRFIGEWGDVIITLRDGTKVDLRSVPKFREIANYCLAMAADNNSQIVNQTATKGF